MQQVWPDRGAARVLDRSGRHANNRGAEEDGMHTLADRVIVVTGGGGAIARSVLGAFAGAGAKLAVVDVTEERARAAADEVAGMPLGVDLARPEGAERMVEAVLAKWGRLDGLVHTVGGFAM